MKRVICLGSSQGDDRVGWDIADALERRLADCGIKEIGVQVCATPAHLPAMLAQAEAALIVDALADAPSGSVQHLSVAELQRSTAWSTHGIDVATALELARALGALPARMQILGIGIGDPACAHDDVPLLTAPLMNAVWQAMIELFRPL